MSVVEYSYDRFRPNYRGALLRDLQVHDPHDVSPQPKRSQRRRYFHD